MAEERKVEQVPAAIEGERNDNGKNNRREYKKDETPIEQLFDLTKPIPRVDRPDKDAHEKELDDYNKQTKEIQDERQKVQQAIDGKMGTGKGSEIGKERDAMAKLRAQKGALIEEKKKILAKLDVIKAQGDKIAKDRKDTRSNVKFSKVEDIEKEIEKLKKRQETTSMSLTEEKKLLKEMEQLQASKSLVAQLKTTEGDMENLKDQRKLIAAQVAAKDKEIDGVQAQINVHFEKIKEMSEKETDKRDVLKELFTKREELRKNMNDIYKQKDACRAAFREQNNAWYNFKRAIAAQKKIEYEAEKKRREEEMAAWQKMKEEEEAKKIPYEEEQALCDYLANHLARVYLTDKEAEAKKAAEEAEAKRAAEIVPVSDDPFAGFKPVKKDDDVEYFGKGKGKKKRDRTKKKEEKALAGPFTLNVDTFEQFALIGLNPPAALDQVEKTIADLRARKVWFSEQTRGSVPTAVEIRKANEKAAAKLKNSTSQNGGSEPAKVQAKAGDKFSLSNDDFVPLGSGIGASSLNATWGQKPPADTALEEETEAPNGTEENA